MASISKKRRQPSRMTNWRQSLRKQGFSMRSLWVISPTQREVDDAVRRIAKGEAAEIAYIEEITDLSGWK
jgi:hypothetical protein